MSSPSLASTEFYPNTDVLPDHDGLWLWLRQNDVVAAVDIPPVVDTLWSHQRFAKGAAIGVTVAVQGDSALRPDGTPGLPLQELCTALADAFRGSVTLAGFSARSAVPDTAELDELLEVTSDFAGPAVTLVKASSIDVAAVAADRGESLDYTTMGDWTLVSSDAQPSRLNSAEWSDALAIDPQQTSNHRFVSVRAPGRFSAALFPLEVPRPTFDAPETTLELSALINPYLRPDSSVNVVAQKLGLESSSALADAVAAPNNADWLGPVLTALGAPAAAADLFESRPTDLTFSHIEVETPVIKQLPQKKGFIARWFGI